MKIKLLTACILLGHSQALTQGTVVESDNGPNVDEYKALCSIGYAVESTEPVTTFAAAPVEDDLDGTLLEILRGNTDEVVAALGELNSDELARLAVLEGTLKDRKGVQEAIADALAAE